MASRTRKRATYDDLVAAPPDKIAELVEGDLYVSPRPRPRHSNAVSVLTSVLNDAFHQGRSGPGGWWILFEPELHLGEDVLVPDIGGWRRERLPTLPDEPWFALSPDWICEVTSPSTEFFDRERKLPIYAAAGVTHLWIVDPDTRTIEVYRREATQWSIVSMQSGAAAISTEPFETIAIELERLWR